IGTWYYTKEMIDCILVWQKKIPALKLLILTRDVEALNTVLAKYSEAQRKTVIRASAAYSEVPAYLKLARASIFFIKPAYSKIASSPTKMAECWSMNLPIITNSGIGDNDLYFKNNLGGLIVYNFTVPAYEQACEGYLKLKSANQDFRSIALSAFDKRWAVEKYLQIYDRLS